MKDIADRAGAVIAGAFELPVVSPAPNIGKGVDPVAGGDRLADRRRRVSRRDGCPVRRQGCDTRDAGPGSVVVPPGGPDPPV